MIKNLSRFKSSCNKLHPLTFTSDIYNSRHIDHTTLPTSQESFNTSLLHYLSEYKNENVGAVFLKLSLKNHSHFFQTANNLGFVFHHAENDIATLVKWIPEDK